MSGEASEACSRGQQEPACSSHLFCRILALTDLVMFFRILNLLITTSSMARVDKNLAWSRLRPLPFQYGHLGHWEPMVQPATLDLRDPYKPVFVLGKGEREGKGVMEPG
jgi:hypothetical protein